MADPVTGTTIFQELKRDALHSEDIERTLEDLKRRLDEHQIPFALIGALAMRRHGYVRYTEDIDLLTTREGLDRIHEKIVGPGYRPRAPGLRKRLRNTVYKVDIDVIQAGENAGSNHSPLEFPHPHSDAFVVEGGIRVPRLERLIEFKLCSGIWGRRPDDLGDVFNLIKVNRLDELSASGLIPEVREKYLELLGDARSAVDIEREP